MLAPLQDAHTAACVSAERSLARARIREPRVERRDEPGHVPEHREQDVSENLADNATMALAPDLPPLRRERYDASGRNSKVLIKRLR